MAENEQEKIAELSTAEETTAESAVASPVESKLKRKPTSNRDVPIATIVHLLGISTTNDLAALEQKLDVLQSKITSVALKVDRMSAQLTQLSNDLYLDRIDFQLADIRQMMKKVFPHVLSTTENMAKEAVERKGEQQEPADATKASAAANATTVLPKE